MWRIAEATLARNAERKSCGDDCIAQLRRHKDSDSRNAWTARSEGNGEVWVRRQAVGSEAASGGMIKNRVLVCVYVCECMCLQYLHIFI